MFVKKCQAIQKINLVFFSGETRKACAYSNIVGLTMLLIRSPGTVSKGLTAGKSEIFTISNQIRPFSLHLTSIKR